MQNISEIETLIKLISKLPGLGPKSAKRIILKLINNEDLKEEMAEKGYQRVLEALNWRRAAESVSEIYENTIKNFQK